MRARSFGHKKGEKGRWKKGNWRRREREKENKARGGNGRIDSVRKGKRER